MAAPAHHQSPPMALHHAVGAPPPPPPPGAQWAPSRQILAMNEAVWVQIGMLFRLDISVLPPWPCAHLATHNALHLCELQTPQNTIDC